ncbi:MAG: isoprenylcysteine carboxylmethyltransferase family protein [Acidobacteria bacterium]|nr:isoprenylcysteine carboxylmethyltransferase family protein [Acidobacteriota bacterium]
MKGLELRIPPLALFVIFVLAILAAGIYIPNANVPFPGHKGLAVLVIILGWVIVGAGVIEFRRAKTTMSPFSPERTALIVSSGIYRWSRNPMYLGMMIVLFGVAAWWSSLPGFLFVWGFYAYMTRFQIKPEERVLLKLFGSEFSAYMVQVHRWL